MLDIKYIREQTDRVRQKMTERGQTYDLDGLLRVDQERRRLVVEVDELKRRRNIASDEITRLKQRRQPADALLAEMKEVSERIKLLDEQIRSLDEQVQERLLYLPNLLHDSVPAGRDEKENKEIRRWGTPPSFDFAPRSHWEIGEKLGILDFERAARVTGARFVFYKGPGARLERALLNLMLDLHTGEHGYEEILPPFIANRASLIGTGQLPKFEEDLFHLRDEDYFLIPTAEVPLTNFHRDEILDEERLPLSYAAYTPCFRREAGSYGKDTRGLIRQHQFNKVELVKFTTPERSYDELERLLQNAESVLQRLGLHYRVVLLCTGDTGFSSAKTYDIEVWLPGQNQFREISSCSNFESFQARRAGIRYRAKGGKKTEYVHTINGSGLAIGRTVVAILENYQRKDGSVAVPEALRPYMGGVSDIRADR
ncbi:MAG TPA: serine--tRNA ligase [Nitrospiria bacterium]|nr:serine--tRNA ligase [Nitrospiria bacterium]